MHDVIVVGAGPGGSAAASFLARAGADVLLLDKSDFPRDKVCGDGLTPQALYWCDRLGCIDEVLAQTQGVIHDCDLFVNGRRVLTGGFPDGTLYPDFAVLLDRRRFDHTLMRNALANGARFRAGVTVRGIERDAQGVTVLARTKEGPASFRARLVIGADGVSSSVSRAIGNTLKDGVMAVSLRTYYRGVKIEGAPIRVYFDRDYFPGYGWLFVDDAGFANIGLGYAFDRNFPLADLAACFRRYVATELADALRGAERCGGVSGGSAAFYRPRTIVDDRVMLVGDAANQADPLNGGGIHKAMEGAFLASLAAAQALEADDLSRQGLANYETLLSRHVECDWQTAEIFLAIAKNPNLRDFCLFVLEQIGRMTSEDPRFEAFCAGVFSGVLSQSIALSPRALYHAFPRGRSTWAAFLAANGGPAAPLRLARGAAAGLLAAGRGALGDPLPNIDWGLEVATKALRLGSRHISAWSGL
ncbi:MAG TPA: geranylgeranyl reductase family protein [Acetobacteraceae bacterium]|nr:geranylgeranyl reductase family protein [Acetobacteraceae bacterium]